MVAEVTQAMVCTMLNGAHCTNDTHDTVICTDKKLIPEFGKAVFICHESKHKMVFRKAIFICSTKKYIAIL